MNETLLALKQQLQKIETLILDKNDVLYFDYPLHLNVGDLLIYAGTEQFFKDYNLNIRLRRSLQGFDVKEAKKFVTPNSTILCHGGGNFGDIYPSIQKMREDLVKAFPNNRIILLPQTAHFSSQEAMQKSASIFAAHKDCHLFARDIKTFEMMKSHFSDKVQLSPDMAHQLYGHLPQKEIAHSGKTLYFLRKDVEKSHIEAEVQATLPNLDHVKDWDDILLPSDIKFELWCSRLSKLATKFNLGFVKNKINDLWYRHALDVIRRCQDVFLGYDRIVTSRLHGHIFSCLLGVPNEVCDNSYGKNTGYYNQWTKDIDYAKTYQN
ncbi:polysaccharide pyruvyl transferase family protein [Actinobacillus pleuropneumoniae]|uniref:Polysaccharide pyruvyl transferase family protein n=1 Tax=Actinobacillus pleuropneumoniae TaxID=715 RepID=A0A9Q4DI51_ACTPL|nr:polysaccharide pyruvyl transferase family protein [Actinobacillus pleuropneumoniae]MCL7721260.1 polysaccharide pyruvyl transferase family protein [Actinobacillus pleuropneumoniae]MCL7727740.1 polysaccharide pyruvyl transferase family protein [Actinobacillus pleuropneumoniae]MCL7729524.1 polysaccharide pyruvyl transferase family protein [Actinobacillus pleuropneumoniae]MCY6367960.1 polysaccharide pyruvyl transferase family protein [Actinobacillus pleuropneumoniae]MCY6384829.1 polysaccharide 